MYSKDKKTFVHAKNNSRLPDQSSGGLPVEEQTSILSVKDIDTINYINKKTERIVSVVYMMTDMFSDDEPLKWEIRKAGLGVLKDTYSVRYAPATNRSLLLGKVTEVISRLASLFEIAGHLGYISEMNSKVLQKEFFDFISFLQLRTTEESIRGQHIPDVSVDEPEDLTDDAIKDISRKTYKGHEPNKQFVPKKMPRMIVPKRTRTIDEIKLSATKKVTKDIGSDDRIKVILNVIREKKEVSMKDVATVVSGYSEKTLQRDLTSLVSQNVLKKTGDRRWSRYSFRNGNTA